MMALLSGCRRRLSRRRAGYSDGLHYCVESVGGGGRQVLWTRLLALSLWSHGVGCFFPVLSRSRVLSSVFPSRCFAVRLSKLFLFILYNSVALFLSSSCRSQWSDCLFHWGCCITCGAVCPLSIHSALHYVFCTSPRLYLLRSTILPVLCYDIPPLLCCVRGNISPFHCLCVYTVTSFYLF